MLIHQAWRKILKLVQNQNIAPCLMDQHVARLLHETAETNDHVHPCLLVFNNGETGARLLATNQEHSETWSFDTMFPASSDSAADQFQHQTMPNFSSLEIHMLTVLPNLSV